MSARIEPGIPAPKAFDLQLALGQRALLVVQPEHARKEQRMRAQGDYEAARAAFIARQPMGRIGKPEEIAALAVYLASDESAFMSGQAISIDGGWTVNLFSTAIACSN